MVVVENIEINGTQLKRTYSDGGFKIRKKGTNEIYDEAIDILDFEYEETDEPFAQETEQGEGYGKQFDWWKNK